jgi:N-acetylmuramoyl-L-alanine amidase
MVKNSKYFTFFGILALALLMGFTPKTPKGKAGGIKIIVIDPGHGGKDPGCNGTSHKEKDVSLAVAMRLGKIIESQFKDVKVIYTRQSDVFVDLEERAQIANRAKADLFISIHCNAAGKPVMIKDKKTGKMRPKTYKNKKGKIVVVETSNPEPFGTETYVMGLKNEEGKMKVASRENSVIFLEEDYLKKYAGFDPESEESYIIMSNYTSSYVIQSANLGMKIQEEYKSKAGRIDKGVHRQSIWVLWRTSMPSILTEIGYLTNPLEEQFLGSEKGQDYLAKALFRGLRRYKDEVEGTKKEYNDEFENQAPLENENIKAGNPIYGKKKEAEDDAAAAQAEKDKTEGRTELTNEDKKTETVKETLPTKENINPSIKETSTTNVSKQEELAALKGQEKDPSVSKTEDTLAVSKKDSVSAKNIANQYAKKTEKTDEPIVIKTTTTSPTPTIALNKSDVVFKVQFLGSDKEVNLKTPTYSVIEKGTYYKMGNVFKYVSGEYSSVADAAKHQAVLKEKGFKDAFIVAFKNGNRIDLNEAKLLAGGK